MPQRPRWGWQAWEATVGYISTQHSPDATLTLQIYPMPYVIGWAAALTWGEQREHVSDHYSLGDALGRLWHQVYSEYPNMLDHPIVLARAPRGYNDDQWLENTTYAIFSRLVHTTDTVFRGDWRIIVLYRPVEKPDKRVQARLLAEKNSVQRAAWGPTLHDACRTLFHNAAPIYSQYRSRDDEEGEHSHD
jgi:hypothetical protein